MLAVNGLRVSEATGADIEALGLERGHRTLTIVRKGGKVAEGIAAADEEGRVVVSKDSELPSQSPASRAAESALGNRDWQRQQYRLSFVELGATGLVVHGEPAGP